ncbi:MAG: 3-phosphoshikimate 1-carboxyvinyltransferase [Syntrophomonadaceae bacterium]|nr:3-phosphoshikimate 1-carboxyvinyltransferase [Syntrophomonadaceae bacterium]
MSITIKKSKPLRGEITVAPDKSISHRAAILSALATGKSLIQNFLPAEDTTSTCRCLEQLGIKVSRKGQNLSVTGQGLNGLKEPTSVLYCGNSGTTMRLLAGLLSSQPFSTVLAGDESLSKRPMKRIIEPLKTMGAEISGRDGGDYPPLCIKGCELKGIRYHMPIASAQVKSALLLAGLNAKTSTVIIESLRSRDHTERMLKAMGANLRMQNSSLILTPGCALNPQEFLVPGDISSAAFFLVAASIIPGSELLIKDVGINPTRDGIIEVLRNMGARITVEDQRVIGGEPVANLIVSSSQLQGIDINREYVPRIIDELPIMAVAMAVADGESSVRGAEELRVKETDRIAAICSELSKLGVSIIEVEDGFTIKSSREWMKGSRVQSWGDHRIAMSLAVAGLFAQGETLIDGCQVVNISFPDFWRILAGLTE